MKPGRAAEALACFWRLACRPDHLRLHLRLQALLRAGGRAEYDAFQEISRIEDRLIADERWRRERPGRDPNQDALERWIALDPPAFLKRFRHLRELPSTRVADSVPAPRAGSGRP